MHILIKKFAADSEILAGSKAGRKLFAKLVESVTGASSPEPLFFDFEGIRTATASYLREGIVAYSEYNRSRDSNLFCVAANLDEAVEEELDFCLRARAGVMLVCSLKKSALTKIRLLGELDPKLANALSAVHELKEVDATTVWQRHKNDEPIKVNAWNNRLAALSAMGIVIEETRGRTKFFKPIIVES
jgi:hypothetical protein